LKEKKKLVANKELFHSDKKKYGFVIVYCTVMNPTFLHASSSVLLPIKKLNERAID